MSAARLMFLSLRIPDEVLKPCLCTGLIFVGVGGHPCLPSRMLKLSHLCVSRLCTCICDQYVGYRPSHGDSVCERKCCCPASHGPSGNESCRKAERASGCMFPLC